MTEHLPECRQRKYLDDVMWGRVSRDEPYVPCICDELRACEERVTRAVMHTVDVGSYEQGRSDTLQELRSRRIARWGASGSSGTPIIMSNGHWVRHDDYLSLFKPAVAEGQQ